AVEQSLQVETVIARAAKEPEGCRYFLIDFLHVAIPPRALRSANQIATEVPLHSRFDTLLKASDEGPPTVKPPEISCKLTQQDRFTRSVRANNGHERWAHEAEAMLVQKREPTGVRLLRSWLRDIVNRADLIGPHRARFAHEAP